LGHSVYAGGISLEEVVPPYMRSGNIRETVVNLNNFFDACERLTS